MLAYRRAKYRPKHVVENIVNKIYHKYWRAFVGHLHILVPIIVRKMECIIFINPYKLKMKIQ
jgi:hypothetical protein